MSKGSKQRPTNKAAYDESYDRIFRSQLPKVSTDTPTPKVKPHRCIKDVKV